MLAINDHPLSANLKNTTVNRCMNVIERSDRNTCHTYKFRRSGHLFSFSDTADGFEEFCACCNGDGTDASRICIKGGICRGAPVHPAPTPFRIRFSTRVRKLPVRNARQHTMTLPRDAAKKRETRALKSQRAQTYMIGLPDIYHCAVQHVWHQVENPRVRMENFQHQTVDFVFEC